MDLLHILSLPNSPRLALGDHGVPACDSGVVPKPSLQSLDVLMWYSAYGSDMEKITTCIYGGYRVSQNGFPKYLPVPAINHSAFKWIQSRMTFVFHVGNGKPDFNTKIVWFFKYVYRVTKFTPNLVLRWRLSRTFMTLTDIIFKNYIQSVNSTTSQSITLLPAEVSTHGRQTGLEESRPDKSRSLAFTLPLLPPYLSPVLSAWPNSIPTASVRLLQDRNSTRLPLRWEKKDGREGCTEDLGKQHWYFSVSVLFWLKKKIISSDGLVTFACKHKSRHRLYNPITFLF